jgi:hypothetical protein
MALNFNVSPYFDDFDPTKNFHRILFKPGYAVQARELTQSQTILQNQISNFASNIFTQNTPVSGGKVTTNLNCYYVRLNFTYNTQNISAGNFLNKTIQDATGTILAKVIATVEGSTNGNNPTLVVTYLSGNQFVDGSIITPIDGSDFIASVATSTAGNPSTGYSSTASISSGVFYIVNGYSQSATQNADGTYTKYSIGNFVQVNPQTVVLDLYGNTPSYRVGLQITETIYDYINDSSLLDPAIGASNYQAPGADRYQISLTLTTLPLTIGNDSEFIELLRINAGQIVKQVDGTVYSTIDDYFAKRDYETNGDYVVSDFSIVPTKYQNRDNPNDYILNIGKGVAYVHGYRIENQSQFPVKSTRARTTDNITTNSIFIDYGNYFVIDTLSGIFDVTTMPTIDLHCVPAAAINSANVNTYTSTLVGTAFIRGLDYQTSSGSNTKTYIFDALVSDVSTTTLTGNVSSATASSIVINDSTDKFSATANAYTNATLSITSGSDYGDIRTITSYNSTTKTITVSPAFTITPATNDTFSIIFNTGIVNSIVQKNPSTYALTANANINVAEGKYPPIPTGTTIYNTPPTAPEMIFNLGYSYVANISNSDYYSTQIYRNYGFSGVGNTFTITSTSPVFFQGTVGQNYSGEAFKQLFTLVNTANGQILDFTNGTIDYATVLSTTQVKFTTATYSTVSTGIDVIASVSILNGDSSSTVYKTKTYVSGNTTTVQTLTAITGNTSLSLSAGNPTGQAYVTANAISTGVSIPLYVTDVDSIVKIVDTGSPGTTASGSLSSYTDITNSFSLDNGQRDNFYDFASIKLLPGVNPPKGNILVVFNYYSHAGSGDGYFSVNSYPSARYALIPSYTAKSGTTYNLRDCIDFRPSRKNAQTAYTWEYFSPGSSNYGTLIPNNLSNYLNSYSYYLGRKDKLVLTKDSQFLIVNGTPSINPQYPTEPDGSLVLANISLDPYTAIIPGEEGTSAFANQANLSINKILHKRWAKSDITDLQTQVDNLAYYTSLSVLEQNANSLQIPDVNGLNRFKNGILVDDFSSFGAADTSDPAFSANINIRKKQLSPITDIVNFQFQNPQLLTSYGSTSLNSVAVSSINGSTTNIFTLPYTTANVVVQQLASSAISVNPFNVVNYQGYATLNPPMDNWVNTIMPPSITITDPTLQFNQKYGGVNAINGGDFASLPGTTTVLTNNNTQTTQNYISQIAGLTAAETSSAVAAGLTTTNGYITNSAVLPYIRPQEVVVRAKGMLVNTPVSCWFDGTSVNQYMINANTIEVTSVSGTFNEDDIIGFKVSNNFYPIARVVSVYNYPNGTSVRLYIATLTNIPTTAPSPATLYSASFDVNGNPTLNASGTVNFNNLIALHTSGNVTGVGGGWTSGTVSTPQNIYKSQYINGFSTLGNNLAVWGDPNNSSSYNTTGNAYVVNLPAGTYTVTAFSTGTGTVYVGASTYTLPGYGVSNSSVTGTYTSAGGNVNVYWNTSSSTTTISGFGLAIQDASGNTVWNSLTPSGLTWSAIGSEYTMPLGGSYYIGSNKIQLDQNASSTNDYYVGAQISVKSTYVYSYNYGAIYVPPAPTFSGDGDAANVNRYWSSVAQYNASVAAAKSAAQSIIYLAGTDWYTANITSYNGSTRTATLDAPVNISLGQNSQYGILTSQYSLTGTVANLSSSITNSIPQLLKTDEYGQFVGIFNIPGSNFFTGERVFRVDNRTVLSDPTTATTYAEATFHATGLLNNSQNFSPAADSSSTLMSPINNQTYNIVSHTSPYDPIAQTFIISKDNYPNGIFLNSVTLFFATKSTTAPITVSIVGTLNGYPNGQTLDYSTVTLNPSQVQVSSTPHYLDETTATQFEFAAPVYIQPGVLYAFTLHSSSADYTVYYAQQNQIAIPSSAIAKPVSQGGVLPSNPTKIGASPYVGALFESQNSITWTADQTKDLMFVMDQCVFNTSQTPTVNFVVPKNLPFRKLGKNSILYNIDANSVPNLIGNQFSPTRPMHALNITTTDFVPSQANIRYQFSTTLNSTHAATAFTSVNPGKFGTPIQDNIYLNDGLGERILLNYSNNSIQLNATLSSPDANVSPIISDDGLTVYSIVYNINNMGIDGNIIAIANSGSGYGPNTVISISSPDIGSDKPVFAYTQNASTNGISSIYVTYPGSGYLTTPTITVLDPTTRTGNSNAVVTILGETSPTGGNGYAKYITKPVILTPGNDSGDLRVYYTAYKPFGTNVYVYYKILNASDTSLLANQSWQLMTQTSNQNVNSTDRNNLIEFECAPGINGSANNLISYTSTNGQTYNSFIQFQIKVVLATSDKTTIPFLTDIRALALPSGTGI